jgi:hypothetical protein
VKLELKVIARFRVSVFPLAVNELPAALIVHWLFCNVLLDGSAIGDPLAYPPSPASSTSYNWPDVALVGANAT